MYRQDKMSDLTPPRHIMDLTAQIVSAHVAHNSVQPAALMQLIQAVYATLSEAGKEPVQAAMPQPAVPIKKSVFPEYIVCLEDGKQLKMLKRHLHTSFQMTPEQYRTRWGLPHDYPMVAPQYAAHRSALAKKIGLGSSRKLLVARPDAGVARGRKAGGPATAKKTTKGKVLPSVRCPCP